MSLRKRYNKELWKNELIYTEKCSPEDNNTYEVMKESDLPDDVDVNNSGEASGFYKYSKGELSDEELKIFALAKINSNLKFIKGCIIFFVILAVIGIILGIVGLAQISSAVHSASTSLLS